MLKRPRIIPTLLIEDKRLVKTRQFRKPNYLGDPINAIKIFNEKYVDELCVLDIVATKEGKEPDYNLLEEMASEAFMPLSYGGGITTLDQIRRIFSLGYEKVILNTSFYTDCNLIRDAVNLYGSQSVVVSVDYKTRFGKKVCFSHDGKKNERLGPVEIAKRAYLEGAGEILLYSIERDGMFSGYDTKTIHEVSNIVDIPVIACGGAENIDDIKRALNSGASAVAAGSLFVYFGAKKAVLINFPAEEDLIKAGIYGEGL